ncbi:MAG: SufE family protein [Lachnospiraceae bacterium]|nr:SufE family protein [Lachnospiraceae bacterium]
MTAEEKMTIAELEDTFIDDLNMLGDWFLQYEYLLEISTELPKIPETERTDENKVPGCQSGVWLDIRYENGKVLVTADSDALIIRGILSVIVSLLSGRTPEEIVAYVPRFIEETNIKQQISTDRFNGIHSVIKSIQNIAEKYV